VRPDRIVVFAPLLDDDSCFLETVEDLAIEQFVAQLAVEALAVTILPGAARRDVKGLT
jgi:hypothetical protein